MHYLIPDFSLQASAGAIETNSKGSTCLFVFPFRHLQILVVTQRPSPEAAASYDGAVAELADIFVRDGKGEAGVATVLEIRLVVAEGTPMHGAAGVRARNSGRSLG